MKRTPLRSRTALALGLCVPLAVAVGIGPVGPAVAAGRSAPSAGAGHGHRLIPRHVYAPYLETWTSDSIPAVARASGARYLTLAFLQTPKPGSCSIAWDGNPKRVVKPGDRYAREIATLRAKGGDVVPSFGGFSADQGGTEIADSCTSV